MKTINKRYVAINKNTGNARKGFDTREAARTFKRENNFRFRIYDNVAQAVVR